MATFRQLSFSLPHAEISFNISTCFLEKISALRYNVEGICEMVLTMVILIFSDSFLQSIRNGRTKHDIVPNFWRLPKVANHDEEIIGIDAM